MLPDVESRGMWFIGGYLGIDRTYEIVPKTIHSITIRNRRGARTMIPVPDGIYVSPGQRTANHQPCQAARQAAPGVPQKCLPRAQ